MSINNNNYNNKEDEIEEVLNSADTFIHRHSSTTNNQNSKKENNERLLSNSSFNEYSPLIRQDNSIFLNNIQINSDRFTQSNVTNYKTIYNHWHFSNYFKY